MKLRLIHKLLIALFACTALVLVLITLVTRASLGRGFIDFLQQQELSQVEQLVPELANMYRESGSWDEVAGNPRNFYRLVFLAMPHETQRVLEMGPEGRGPPPMLGDRRRAGLGPRQQGPRGGPGMGNAMLGRLFLLDADHSTVIGDAPPDFDEDQLLPIEVDNAVVGWLGVTLPRGIELPEEEAFIQHQRTALLIGLGIGLAVAALLAWLLARHLSRPINEVAGGIRELAAGNFNTRLVTAGGDEIAQLGNDVNRLSTALSEHETARKRWMSDMAHELRTPLAIITGELEAMSDGVRPLNREQLGSVQAEVKHLAVLVDDLHNLALTDSGALAYKMHPLNLNELVESAVDSFRGNAIQKELELSLDQPAQSVNVCGDEQRLRQLLRNLLDNSVCYTDAGGHIFVRLKAGKGQAQLTISDTAPGADTQECERLFERLYRPEASRNRNLGGSGLGLAICRNIVEAHGGRITAEPGPEGGLLITTILPLER
jgi:two-component system sensor histidine kinase BaeS